VGLNRTRCRIQGGARGVHIVNQHDLQTCLFLDGGLDQVSVPLVEAKRKLHVALPLGPAKLVLDLVEARAFE
jgi:hypothetical protein